MTATDPSLRDWGAVYAVSREERDRHLDAAVEVCERRIREAARAAGHEPVGRVIVTWHNREPGVDPDNQQADDHGLDLDGYRDPTGKVWATVVVAVRPGGAAKASLTNCRRCGGRTTPAMVQTPAGPQVQVLCARCDL